MPLRLLTVHDASLFITSACPRFYFLKTGQRANGSNGITTIRASLSRSLAHTSTHINDNSNLLCLHYTPPKVASLTRYFELLYPCIVIKTHYTAVTDLTKLPEPWKFWSATSHNQSLIHWSTQKLLLALYTLLDIHPTSPLHTRERFSIFLYDLKHIYRHYVGFAFSNGRESCYTSQKICQTIKNTKQKLEKVESSTWAWSCCSRWEA